MQVSRGLMESLQIDRRKNPPGASERAHQKENVKQGIRLQACLGTIGALEYLKSRSIEGAVIARLLSSGRLRREDRDAWRRCLQSNAPLAERLDVHALALHAKVMRRLCTDDVSICSLGLIAPELYCWRGRC